MKVLSKPRCPKCRGDQVARLGFLKAKGGSEYICGGSSVKSECRHRFVVPTLQFQIQERRETR